MTALCPEAARWIAEPPIHAARHFCQERRIARLFDEDRSTVRAGDIPQVMATLRSTAISVARLHGATNIAACRRYAAQPDLALAAIGLIPRL